MQPADIRNLTQIRVALQNQQLNLLQFQVSRKIISFAYIVMDFFKCRRRRCLAQTYWKLSNGDALMVARVIHPKEN